jgi:hypothetical protein
MECYHQQKEKEIDELKEVIKTRELEIKRQEEYV